MTGVSAAQIISVNLEDGEFQDLETSKQLFTYVDQKLLPDKQMYIFLDEVQRISEFQKAVDSLYVKKNVTSI